MVTFKKVLLCLFYASGIIFSITLCGSLYLGLKFGVDSILLSFFIVPPAFILIICTLLCLILSWAEYEKAKSSQYSIVDPLDGIGNKVMAYCLGFYELAVIVASGIFLLRWSETAIEWKGVLFAGVVLMLWPIASSLVFLSYQKGKHKSAAGVLILIVAAGIFIF